MDVKRSSNLSEKSSIGYSSPLIASENWLLQDADVSLTDIKLAVAASTVPGGAGWACMLAGHVYNAPSLAPANKAVAAARGRRHLLVHYSPTGHL